MLYDSLGREFAPVARVNALESLCQSSSREFAVRFLLHPHSCEFIGRFDLLINTTDPPNYGGFNLCNRLNVKPDVLPGDNTRGCIFTV